VGGAVAFAAESYFQLGDNISAYHGFFPFSRAGNRACLTIANLSIDQSVVEHVGMMAPHLNYADVEWTTRFRVEGYLLYFEPQAIICHRPARLTYAAVWRRWEANAPDNLRFRLRYAAWLNTPFLARYRWLFLWGAPLIAAWATMRTFAHPRIRALYWHTLPFVYLTKLAWCWGAFKQFPRAQQPSPVAHRKRICTM
jgi:GT2 family glycosyltransferase